MSSELKLLEKVQKQEKSLTTNSDSKAISKIFF